MTNYFKYNQVIKCNDTKEICIGYANYLKSKHWALMRKRLIPKNNICFMCQNKKDHLQLHHITYKNIGNESDKDLIPLCENCHRMIHKYSINVSTLNNSATKKKPKYEKYEKGKKQCSKCKYYTQIDIKSKSNKSFKKPFCKYTGTIIDRDVCDNFRYKRKN